MSNIQFLFVVVGGCPDPSPCGPNQYRGSDCRCYCQSDDINDPVVLCPNRELTIYCIYVFMTYITKS